MARPQTKQELLDSIHVERSKLNKALQGLSEAQQLQPGACGDWSVKDILAHLIDWEQRCLHWYHTGQQGEVPKPPDENFNWRELPALNNAIYEKYRDWSWIEIHNAYENSFQETLQILQQMTEEELFTADYYPWTGNSLLRDYFNSCTASHYRWASKLIRSFIRHNTDGNS
jgi:hypothetical protein